MIAPMNTPPDGPDPGNRALTGLEFATQIGIKFASGRRAGSEAIDCLLHQVPNMQKFYDRCQEVFDDDPLAFWQRFVLPLLPPRYVLDSMQEGGPSDADEFERFRLEAIRNTFTMEERANDESQ
jgi:hypothetical protein